MGNREELGVGAEIELTRKDSNGKDVANRYRIGEVLGSGGGSVVYKAFLIEAALLASINALDEDAWRQLPEERKIDTLQSIVDYECQNVLGCKPVTVMAADLEEGPEGKYNTLSGILIKRDGLGSWRFAESLYVSLHELRHHYHFMAIAAMKAASGSDSSEYSNSRLDIFRDARDWEENYGVYKTSEKDGSEAYESQQVEVDANAYADSRMKEYYYAVIDFNENRRLE